MNIIAVLDLISVVAGVTGIIIIAFIDKRLLSRDSRWFILILLSTSLGYYLFKFIDWMGISHSLEAVEDMIGALLPMSWLFLLFALSQKSINHELMVNKENLRITLDAIGDAVIVTDVSGCITRMNPVAEQLSGWDFKTAAGRHLNEVLHLVDSTSMKKIKNPTESVLESGKTISLGNQTILVSKNGAQYHITDSAAPICNARDETIGVVIVFSDITEKYLQTESLRSSIEHYKTALNFTSAGIWDWHIRTGEFICDQQWAGMLGYEIRELEPISHKTSERLMHPEDLVRSDELIDKHFRGLTDAYECETRMRHKDGRWIWMLQRGKTLVRDKQGKPMRMTGTQIDISSLKNNITELKSQVDENQALAELYIARNEELMRTITTLQKSNKELKEAKFIAEENDRLKSAFLANMSHEIRTPMNGIIGFSNMLVDPDISLEKRTYYAKIIVDSSVQLLTLVNDILDISRIETGKVALLYEEVKVNDLMNMLFAFFEPQAQRKQIELRVVKTLGNTQSKINTDKTRLRQVLTNLLNNAVKFTNEGSIEFGYHLKDELLEFYVEDSGIGIASDMHEKIFEPFSQAEHDGQNQLEGTGLGLSISRKLVDLLGGTIWVESEPGMGSRFSFTVPYNNTVSSYLKSHDKKEKERETHAITPGMLVLIAEDDDINYLYIEAVLSKIKVKIMRAHNGLEAVEICRNQPDIQMVFMDIKMPFMNGLDATKKIKEINPDLPVIAQTAYAMNEDKSKAFEAGCDGYISKPIKKAELIAFIDRYCSPGK